MLKLDPLKLVTCSDLSFVNHLDHGTLLRYAILMQDKANRTNWLTFKSYKWQRVLQAKFKDKTDAFADGFDTAMFFVITGRKLSLRRYNWLYPRTLRARLMLIFY